MSEVRWYKPAEFADQLGVDVRQVYRLIRDGRLAHIHVGKVIRVPGEELDRILAHSHDVPKELNVSKCT